MLQNLSTQTRFRSRLLVWLPLVGAGMPPLLIAATVVRYGVNVPYWDQWNFVNHVDKVYTGQFGFADVWVQANEHRIILPGLVMLALAWVSGWDIRYELAANVVAALGVLGMLALLIHQTIRPVAPRLTSWLVLIVSLTTFSLTQWENWLWGWQLQVFMNALAAVVTIWALARWGAQWRGLVFGLLAATAGVFSFATGLMLLALVPLGLLMMPRCNQGAGRLKRVALAIGCGAGVVTLYLIGFRYPSYSPTPLFLFSHPLSYAHYILTFLGSGLGAWSKTVSALWGAVGIVIFSWCGAWLWTRSPQYRHTLFPWILLGLYGVLSGIMTGIGRAGFGVDQALSPRYITISSLFWVSLVVIVGVTMTQLPHETTVSRDRALTLVAVMTSLLTLAGLSYGASGVHAKAAIEARSSALRRGGECLADYNRAPDECLRMLFSNVAHLKKAAHRLQSLSLGPFAWRILERPLSSYAVVSGPERAGYIDDVAVPEVRANQTLRSGDVVISGWGMDPFSRSPAVSALVVIDGQVMGRARIGEQRADVAKALGWDGLLRSGWTFRFGVWRLTPGPHRVEAYALLNGERRIVQLVGSRVIEIRK